MAIKMQFILRWDGVKWCRWSGPWESLADKAIAAARKAEPKKRFCLVPADQKHLSVTEKKDGHDVERLLYRMDGQPLLSEPFPMYHKAEEVREVA